MFLRIMVFTRPIRHGFLVNMILPTVTGAGYTVKPCRVGLDIQKRRAVEHVHATHMKYMALTEQKFNNA